ncbi:hypothetical protein GJ629_01920 [Halapricum sp. CBA1109]|uniref:hypothetical protein n=1 Tax=Halapricum sp. CBA1109 TaxID=2668068 RepID=UPI0012FBB9F9|nr:hypothetical protein [Halapricum sp. CBA1109]MUV88797.1 hypothetical protein [Halapricum sp. CBA1109]
MEYVDLLLENVDANEVLITSDHGNAMGEYGYYGHPRWTPIKSLKEVPAVRTSATDSGEYEPSTERTEGGSNQDIEERLRDLGYL